MQRFKQILVEEAAWDYPMTRRVLARLPGVPVKVIADREALRPREVSPAQWLGEAKTTLLLAVQKGPFWRACPGTRDYICCGYQVLQVALNCPFDCTYCILQSYVNVPGHHRICEYRRSGRRNFAPRGQKPHTARGAWEPGSLVTVWPWTA